MVRRVETFILSRPAARFSTASLANAVGVSRRTLHRGFAQERGYGPMEAVRRARLISARSELLNAGAGVSVTDVSMRWGFFHLSRFSGLYLAHFGELPSATLRGSRKRAQPTAESSVVQEERMDR